MERRLSAEVFEQEELFSVKIPIGLPYWNNQKTEAEHVKGRFEVDGIFYTMHKQQIENDTLTLICVRDRSDQNLLKKLSNFLSISQDLPGTQERAIHFFDNLLKDYMPLTALNIEVCVGRVASAKQFFEYKANFPSVYLLQIAPPPRTA